MYKLRTAKDLKKGDHFKIHHAYCGREEMDVIFKLEEVEATQISPSNDGSVLLLVTVQDTSYFHRHQKSFNEKLPVWLDMGELNG